MLERPYILTTTLSPPLKACVFEYGTHHMAVSTMRTGNNNPAIIHTLELSFFFVDVILPGDSVVFTILCDYAGAKALINVLS